MSKLISLVDLPNTPDTRPLIDQLKPLLFDANVYIMLGHDSQYIHGKRCYDRAMEILSKIKQGKLL